LLRRLGHDKFSIGVDRLFPDGGGISGREKGCRHDGGGISGREIAPPSSGDLLPPSSPAEQATAPRASRPAFFPGICLCHDAPYPLRRDKRRPVAASPGGRALETRCNLSKNIRCFSNMRRLPSSASSSDSAISERWPVSSARLTITRWRAIWTANSAICRLACA